MNPVWPLGWSSAENGKARIKDAGTHGGHASDALLWGEVDWRVAVTRWHRQQICDQWGNLAEVVCRLPEHHFELVQPLFGCVLASESGRPFELPDGRVERAVLLMGRAEKAQRCMWRVVQPLQRRLSKA